MQSPMSHATRWISKLTFLILTMQLSACALFEERSGPPTSFGPRDQVYYATFEEVWRATNLVLQPYPLRVSNMDQGLLETDLIRGHKVFNPPFKVPSTAAESYRLIIHVIRGNLENRAATKVTVLKSTEVQVDFFSDPKRDIPSTGLEEKFILYRIGREVVIERGLAKIQKKQNNQQN